MLLGLIGILVFFFNQTKLTQLISQKMAKWGTQDPRNPDHVIACEPEQLVELFEKVHLGIFANMGIYFITCLWLVLLHWIIYKHWIRIDYEPFDLDIYRDTLTQHRNDSLIYRYLNIVRLWKLWRMRAIDRLHALRDSCIEQYGLPPTFPFSRYCKLAMRDVVIHILDVHPVCWALLILAFGFTLVRISILRVDNSEKTIIIYGSLSLFVSLVSLFVLISAARVYGGVLRLASVKRYLHIRDEDSSDERSTSINIISEETLDEEVSLIPTGRSSLMYTDTIQQTAKEKIISKSEPFIPDKSLDSKQRSFEDVAPGQPLHFSIFNRFGETMTLMTVDEYRIHSTLVANILKRAQIQTADDSEHKSMWFFRSRKYLVFALQMITFVQSWLLGLSIYYGWSVYHDHPTDIPKHPALFLYVAVGPLITYGLMGMTLEKLVKSTSISADRILETLYAPHSEERVDQSSVSDSWNYIPSSSMQPRPSSNFINSDVMEET
jgi:hypothetical protein